MIRLLFATAILMLACFNNGHAAETSDELADCRAIQSDDERVACYDAIAGGQVEEEVVVIEATAIQATANEEVPPTDETFGLPPDDINRESKDPDGSDDVESLTATVTGVSLYKVDRVMVTLDNGQQWRQTSVSTLKLSVDDKIEIRKGAMGSYRLTEVDGTRAMKVRRVD